MLSIAVAVVFWFQVRWALDDLRPRYLEATEEVLVDTSRILASLVSEHMDVLPGTFARALDDIFSAHIYRLHKTHVDLRVYVTNQDGIVQYDSLGLATGEDFSAWRDVALCLRGEYRARSTRLDPEDPNSSVLHIAAPIKRDGLIVGVLTVAKPVTNLAIFTQFARQRIVTTMIYVALGAALLLLMISYGIARPLRRLERFVRLSGEDKRATLPRLGSGEVQRLGQAFETMRDQLAGRQYAKEFVQTLTHEMKSPLTALRGLLKFFKMTI